MDYNPPTLSDDEISELRKQIQSWIRSNGVAHVPKLLAVLVTENATQLKEINDLRAQLNIPHKPGYKLR